MKTRRFWPLLFILAVWLVIVAGPRSRAAFWRVLAPPISDQINGDFYSSLLFNPQKGAPDWAKNDRRVLVLEAAQNEAKIAIPKLDALTEKFPDDPFILAWRLKHSSNYLIDNRYGGPLTNPNFPKPPPKNFIRSQAKPRAAWEKMAQIARRGQKLRPNNTYFDWMLIYALVGMRRDDEARAVLKAATRKTDYDDFTRQEIQTKIAVRRMSGALSPTDEISIWAATLFPHFARFRQTTRVMMEHAIDERAKGNHQNAIDTAFGLMHLGSLMRQNGYSAIGSLVGTAIEKIALFSWFNKAKIPKLGAKISLAQSKTFNLVGYAEAHNRPEVARFATGEWNVLGKWSKLRWGLWNGTEKMLATSLILERWGRIVWRSLLPILVLWMVASLGARRWKWNGAPPLAGAAKRNFGVMAPFILALLAGDLALFFHGWNPTMDFSDFLWSALGNYELSSAAPFLVRMGAAGVLVLTALGFVAKWQRSHLEKPPSLRERLKKLMPPTVENLANFDFSFLFHFIGRLTFWILALAGFAAFVWLPQPRGQGDNAEIFGASWAIFLVVWIVLMAFQLGIWRHLPHRRASLVLSIHTMARMAGAYLVGASLVLALLVFAALPVWSRFDQQFDRTIQVGELALARQKAGL